MSLYFLYSILILTFIAVFFIFFYLFRAAKILLFFDTFVLFSSKLRLHFIHFVD